MPQPVQSQGPHGELHFNAQSSADSRVIGQSMRPAPASLGDRPPPSAAQFYDPCATIETASPFDSARRVWCQSPLPHYTLETQRYVQPARCIPLVRPGRDLIVLPGNHQPTRQMWEFNKTILGLDDAQAIWTGGARYNMDQDMCALTLSELKRRITAQTRDCKDCRWLLVPYAPQPEFVRWAAPLIIELQGGGIQVTVFGETPEWLHKYGDKGLLHRHMDRLDEPSAIEKIDPDIVVPRGYVCETVEHLLAARELLGDTECCIKPLAGATGVGIVLQPTLEFLQSYEFPLGPVNVEEFLKLDVDEEGEAISPAVHYLGSEMVGDYMLDQIMDGCAYTGENPAHNLRWLTVFCADCE